MGFEPGALERARLVLGLGATNLALLLIKNGQASGKAELQRRRRNWARLAGGAGGSELAVKSVERDVRHTLSLGERDGLLCAVALAVEGFQIRAVHQRLG